jgi:AraC-like DNA-binding protein
MEPHPDLAPWIQNYWMLTPAQGGQADVEIDVYVDARADLVFNFGAPYFRRVLGREEVEYRSSNLDAQRRKPIRIRQTGQAATVGVRFLAGGLAPFLRVFANRITDRTPPPGEVFDPSVRDAEEALGRSIGNAEAASGILDGFFLATRRLTPGVEDFRRLRTELESNAVSTSIETLCESRGFTPRSADRLFARYLGLSPKLYARIVRFQGALKFLMKDPGIGLAEVGLKFGYFDQSHFVKDFKAFTGGVPRGYRGYYPTDQPADFAPNIVRFLQDD